MTIEILNFFGFCFQSYFEFILNFNFFYFCFVVFFFYWFGYKVYPEGSHLSGLTKGQKQKRQLQISMVTNPQVPPSPLQWSLQPTLTRTKMWHCCRSCVIHQLDGLEGQCITRRRDSGRLGRINAFKAVLLFPCPPGELCPLSWALIPSLQHVWMNT